MHVSHADAIYFRRRAGRAASIGASRELGGREPAPRLTRESPTAQP